jgi:hypothetical protein
MLFIPFKLLYQYNNLNVKTDTWISVNNNNDKKDLCFLERRLFQIVNKIKTFEVPEEEDYNINNISNKNIKNDLKRKMDTAFLFLDV